MLNYRSTFDQGIHKMQKALILSLFLVSAGLQAGTWDTEVKAAVKLQRQGKLKQAEESLMKAQLEAERFGPQDPRGAYTLDFLGTLYMQEGAKDEALAVFAKALRGFDASLGPDSKEASESAQRLAEAYEAAEQWDKAVPLYRRLCERARKDPKIEPLALAECISNLAFALDAEKKWDEALPLYDEALALRTKTLGAESAEAAETLNNQARVWLLKGDAPKAVGLFRRALAIDQKALGKEHSSVADDMRRLAAALKKAGQLEEAASYEQQALAMEDKLAELAAKQSAPSPKATLLSKP
jgi:tetratricopeptide (TPR) repeat protein